MLEKLCTCGCGRAIESRRSTRKYFEDACRQKAYRRRQESHHSFELVGIRKKVAGDLMRAGILPEGAAGAAYDYAPAPRTRGRGAAAKARTRPVPETLEAYQRRTKGTADLWRFSSGIFDSQTVSPNPQRIPGVKPRRGFGESKPPPGVNQKSKPPGLTVTHPIYERTISVNTAPTIAQRLTNIEIAVEQNSETLRQVAQLTRNIAAELGLPPDHDAVQKAVDDFIKTALD
jgi:hypothetical protein